MNLTKPAPWWSDPNGRPTHGVVRSWVEGVRRRVRYGLVRVARYPVASYTDPGGGWLADAGQRHWQYDRARFILSVALLISVLGAADPQLGSTSPHPSYRASANTLSESIAGPATTIIPSDWITRPLARLKLLLITVRTLPSPPKVGSRIPLLR